MGGKVPRYGGKGPKIWGKVPRYGEFLRAWKGLFFTKVPRYGTKVPRYGLKSFNSLKPLSFPESSKGIRKGPKIWGYY
jgi:hypothetical protein